MFRRSVPRSAEKWGSSTESEGGFAVKEVEACVFLGISGQINDARIPGSALGK